MLPAHPQPYPEEILSSWMVRLAFANDFRLHPFYAGIIGYKQPIWNRDVDRRPTKALLQSLAHQTGQPVCQLQAMALQSLDGVLFDSPTAVTNPPWILPLGIVHRTHNRFGMQFCPQCLLEDDVAYYRLQWRLAFHVICPLHGCRLLDACPCCDAPVAFLRHGIGKQRQVPSNALSICTTCGFDLRNSLALPFEWADLEAMQILFSIQAAGVGYYAQGEAPFFSNNVLFFKGLHTLVNLIHGRHSSRITSALITASGVSLDETKYPRSEFCCRRLSTRIPVLQAAAWLLVDWPNRFVETCEKGRLSQSRIVENSGILPYWVASVVGAKLNQRVYLPSFSEIFAAGEYLLSKNLKVNSQTLGNVLGTGRDFSLRSARIWREWYPNQCGKNI